MASYTVASTEWAAWEKALSAATVDTVTFTGRDLKLVEVFNHDGTAPLYVTTDGSTPTDKAAAVRYMVPPLQSAQFPPKSSGSTVVKVISRAVATYSVADAS